MIDVSKLNHIARIAIACFEDAGFDDAYIQGKVKQLEELDKWETIFWATHQLDIENRERFSHKVGVPLEILTMTFETIRKIEFKA